LQQLGHSAVEHQRSAARAGSVFTGFEDIPIDIENTRCEHYFRCLKQPLRADRLVVRELPSIGRWGNSFGETRIKRRATLAIYNAVVNIYDGAIPDRSATLGANYS
jgi:hypothetical protein